MSDYLGERRTVKIKELQNKLTQYFISNNISTSKKYPYILADWDD